MTKQIAKATIQCEITISEGPAQAILHFHPENDEQREVTKCLEDLGGLSQIDQFPCTVVIAGASTGLQIVFDKSITKD